ncbi:MAG: hypothetical protein M1834_003670 [Cirrosporium novae-zelandiae]|nr:MAG: hypothetical protein M1834_003670 [Cirrosporium novae-zelandiae]
MYPRIFFGILAATVVFCAPLSTPTEDLALLARLEEEANPTERDFVARVELKAGKSDKGDEIIFTKRSDDTTLLAKNTLQIRVEDAVLLAKDEITA